MSREIVVQRKRWALTAILRANVEDMAKRQERLEKMEGVEVIDPLEGCQHLLGWMSELAERAEACEDAEEGLNILLEFDEALFLTSVTMSMLGTHLRGVRGMVGHLDSIFQSAENSDEADLMECISEDLPIIGAAMQEDLSNAVIDFIGKLNEGSGDDENEEKGGKEGC